MNRIAQEAHARQRYLEYFLKHKNATETAIRYRISRKTLYKWLKRYDGTWQSLVERSRRPHSSPRAHTAEEIRHIRRLAKKHRWEDLLLAYQEMREKYGYSRSYGGFKRIVAKLRAEKGNKKRKKRKNKPYQRAESCRIRLWSHHSRSFRCVSLKCPSSRKVPPVSVPVPFVSLRRSLRGSFSC